MNHTTRVRLAGLLLPLSVGVVGAIGYAVNNSNNGNDGKPANQAAGDQPSGTGTVAASPSPGGNGQGNKPPGTGPSGVFSISGQVSGLVPGAPKTLALTVNNPNPWPIQVLTLQTGVGTANHSPCPASTLVVGDYTYHDGDPIVRVAAKGTAQVSVPITLADSLTVDQSGCPSATFPLTFTGTATQVPGR
jgi:hypothetical protein